MNEFNNAPDDVSGHGCPSCGECNVYQTNEIEIFQYGQGKDKTDITVNVEVYHCKDCEFSFTDEKASDIRHEAVCRHLGVLSPKEVRAVREQYSLSQAEFSEVTKIGKASLARWETGFLVQNHANDNFIYLLTFPENFNRLKDRDVSLSQDKSDTNHNVVPFRPRFRSIKDDDRILDEAKKFELHPAATG